jgi:NADPH:quinone reductase-like Zn-dependent oxidoreductase
MTQVPTTMRAAVLTGRGGPDKLVLRDDVAVPVPRDDEVLVRVAACGVNNTDVNTRVGWYSRTVTAATSGDGFAESRSEDSTWGGSASMFPRIQGADPCGTVVAAGAEADESLIGCRVVVDPWIRDRDRPSDRDSAGYLGSERDGGFAEYCAVPARNVHPITADLSDVEAAGLACSWSTAAHMLHRVRLSAGQRIAVTGASGGVGSALVRLASIRGAEVTAIAGADKLRAVAAFGADHLVARHLDDVPAAARSAAGGAFDVVADVVGGDDFAGWLDALARGGRYVTSGAIAGPVVDLDLRTLYLNDLELYGATIFEPSVFEDLVALVNAGQVRPPVAATFPLERIHEAQAAFGDKSHVGKIVITIADGGSDPA